LLQARSTLESRIEGIVLVILLVVCNASVLALFVYHSLLPPNPDNHKSIAEDKIRKILQQISDRDRWQADPDVEENITKRLIMGIRYHLHTWIFCEEKVEDSDGEMVDLVDAEQISALVQMTSDVAADCANDKENTLMYVWKIACIVLKPGSGLVAELLDRPDGLHTYVIHALRQLKPVNRLDGNHEESDSEEEEGDGGDDVESQSEKKKKACPPPATILPQFETRHSNALWTVCRWHRTSRP